MDEKLGTTVFDESGNNLNGTLGGNPHFVQVLCVFNAARVSENAENGVLIRRICIKIPFAGGIDQWSMLFLV